jgi:hypothetical protein
MMEWWNNGMMEKWVLFLRVNILPLFHVVLPVSDKKRLLTRSSK